MIYAGIWQLNQLQCSILMNLIVPKCDIMKFIHPQTLYDVFVSLFWTDNFNMPWTFDFCSNLHTERGNELSKYLEHTLFTLRNTCRLFRVAYCSRLWTISTYITAVLETACQDKSLRAGKYIKVSRNSSFEAKPVWQVNCLTPKLLSSGIFTASCRIHTTER